MNLSELTLSMGRPCEPQDAKGDQCDNCGTMLNPTELINPRCKITGTTPVLRKTKHLFLDLPKLTPELQAYINTTSQLGGWSANCVAVSPGGSPGMFKGHRAWNGRAATSDE